MILSLGFKYESGWTLVPIISIGGRRFVFRVLENIFQSTISANDPEGSVCGAKSLISGDQ